METLYIRVYRKKIEIRNVKTNEEISYAINQTYSNNRILVADFEVFEEELRNAIKQIIKPRLIKRSLQFAFQPIDESVTEFSPVEMRVFRDSSEHAGAKEVYIFKSQKKFTNEEIMEGINTDWVTR